MPGASGASSSAGVPAGASTSARPSTRSIAARGTPPGRSSIGSPRQATIVELDADACRPAVDNEIDAAAQIGLHMRRRRRRNMAGTVGRGRDHGLGEGLEDIARDRVVGNADGDAVETGGRKLGDRTVRRLRQYERQRAGPERGSELGRVGVKACEPLQQLDDRATWAISGLNAGRPLAS